MRRDRHSELDYAKQSNLAITYFSEKLSFEMAISKLKAKIDAGEDDFKIIDARHEDVFAESRIPGATFVDADNLEAHWDSFEKEKINVVYCYSELCHRAARVCLAAALEGFPVMELHGGFEGWAKYPMPLEK